MVDSLPLETPQILRDLNSWWETPTRVRPMPPTYRRRHVAQLQRALAGKQPLIQVLRGPRQVGKTTALYQVVAERLAAGVAPSDILFVRFDLQPLQETSLTSLLAWYVQKVRGRFLAF